MKYSYKHKTGDGELLMHTQQTQLERWFLKLQQPNTFHSIAWNKGEDSSIIIDNVTYPFPSKSIIPLTLNQSFIINNASDIVLWQFNRDFYCIYNHDAEVGCIGFIFFGPKPNMLIQLDEIQQQKMHRLYDVFIEEFEENEDIKNEMLRASLVKLIVEITRIAKKQYADNDVNSDEKIDLLRQYNVLVEMHFKQQHQVQFYAAQLHKSPKTLSNIFAQLKQKTPLQIIHERIISEAKRLFFYTDKSVKEIADELGFEDAAHFSKFFKNQTNQTPSLIKKK